METKYGIQSDVKRNLYDENDQQTSDESDDCDFASNKILNYNEWLDKRKSLRKNLNDLDLNTDYLKRKQDLSECEKRVLKDLLAISEDSNKKESDFY